MVVRAKNKLVVASVGWSQHASPTVRKHWLAFVYGDTSAAWLQHRGPPISCPMAGEGKKPRRKCGGGRQFAGVGQIDDGLGFTLGGAGRWPETDALTTTSARGMEGMGYGREREMQFASRRDLKKRDEWKTTHKGCRIAFDPTKRARPAQRFDRRTGSKRFPNLYVLMLCTSKYKQSAKISSSTSLTTPDWGHGVKIWFCDLWS